MEQIQIVSAFSELKVRPIVHILCFEFFRYIAMPFESLLNKPMSEVELLKLVIDEIQSQYLDYRNTHFTLKLSKFDDSRSQIVWAKNFASLEEQEKFHCYPKFKMAYVAIRFTDQYRILFKGFFLSDLLEIDRHQIIERMPTFRDGSDFEKEEDRMSWDLVKSAFGELTGLMESRSGKKSA